MSRNDELSRVLIEFARTLVTDFPIQGILDHLVRRIVDVLPIDAAGVTLISPTMPPHFMAASDDSALHFVELQTELAEGPCLEAYRTQAPVAVPDLGAEGRFAGFRARALGLGLAAVFTFPLRDGTGCLGALDLYRRSPGELSPAEMESAQTLADVAAAYLINAQARADLRAAAELEHTAVEKLHRLDQARSEFVATASHELRTPVTNIAGYAELLEEGAGDSLAEDQATFLDAICRNSERLMLLIDNVLTLSGLDSDFDAPPVETIDLDLREVLKTAGGTVVLAARNKQLDLQFDTPHVAVLVHGNVVQLERMVTNLLTNAVKFSRQGGWVRCALRSEGRHAVLQISDNGLGIPAEDQQALFTRFFRASTAWQHAVQGSGLGLTIVKAIVDRHDGRVSVSSAEGKGTTFVVRVPLASAAVVPGQRLA